MDLVSVSGFPSKRGCSTVGGPWTNQVGWIEYYCCSNWSPSTRVVLWKHPLVDLLSGYQTNPFPPGTWGISTTYHAYLEITERKTNTKAIVWNTLVNCPIPKKSNHFFFSKTSEVQDSKWCNFLERKSSLIKWNIFGTAVWCEDTISTFLLVEKPKFDSDSNA